MMFEPLPQDCGNVAVEHRDGFCIKNIRTGRFIVSRGKSGGGVSEGRVFKGWKYYDDKNKSFVANDGKYDWLIFPDGNCSRNFQEIGPHSLYDYSRPAKIEYNGMVRWFYIGPLQEECNCSIVENGRKVPIYPRVCGYDVRGYAGTKLHLAWNCDGYKTMDYLRMDSFLPVDGSKTFFLGTVDSVRGDVSHRKTQRLFRARRRYGEAREMLMPHIAPDVYSEVRRCNHLHEDTFIVSFMNGCKAVLIYNEKKGFIYWTATDEGEYVEIDINQRLLFVKKKSGKYAILDKNGIEISAICKEVHWGLTLVSYTTFDGKTKTCKKEQVENVMEELKKRFLKDHPVPTTVSLPTCSLPVNDVVEITDSYSLQYINCVEKLIPIGYTQHGYLLECSHKALKALKPLEQATIGLFVRNTQRLVIGIINKRIGETLRLKAEYECPLADLNFQLEDTGFISCDKTVHRDELEKVMLEQFGFMPISQSLQIDSQLSLVEDSAVEATDCKPSVVEEHSIDPLSTIKDIIQKVNEAKRLGVPQGRIDMALQLLFMDVIDDKFETYCKDYGISSVKMLNEIIQNNS